jgi:hypothetical protein
VRHVGACSFHYKDNACYRINILIMGSDEISSLLIDIIISGLYWEKSLTILILYFLIVNGVSECREVLHVKYFEFLSRNVLCLPKDITSLLHM